MRTVELPIMTDEDNDLRPAYAVIADLGKKGMFIFDTALCMNGAENSLAYYKKNETTPAQAKCLEIVKVVWVRE